MIAYLVGVVEEKSEGTLVLDVNGVGYELSISNNTLVSLPIEGETAKVLTYMQVKEDGICLFGFATSEEKAMFMKLITVSGVGPKMALNILNQFELKTLINCVVQEKEKELTQAKGVGSKLAQKIILELKDKFINVELEPEKEDDDMFTEVKNMLLSLQYTLEEINKAKDIVYNMNCDFKSSEDLLREILKVLSE